MRGEDMSGSTRRSNRLWRASVFGCAAITLIIFAANVTSCSLSTILNGGKHYAVGLAGSTQIRFTDPRYNIPVPGILFNKDSIAATYRFSGPSSGTKPALELVGLRWEENPQLATGMVRVYFLPALILFSILPLVAFLR